MDHKDETQNPTGLDPHGSLDDQKGLSRRQFLTYVLGGTGAFMGTMVAAPMVVSAFDPLHRSGRGSWSKTTWKVSDFNDKLPTHVKFSQHMDDAWNSQNKDNDVYVIKFQSKLMIMSHVCTHLGCHVNGSESGGKSVAPQYNGGQDWFLCPCHGSLYNNYGVPTPSSPAPDPLSLFDYKIENSVIYVGQEHKRTKATWNDVPGQTI